MLEYDNRSETAVVTCDGCPYTEDFEGTFQEVIDEMKDQGWKITKTEDTWEHYCEDCSGL